MLEIKPVAAFQDNYIWLIVNPDNNTVAIVDPGDADPVLNEINRNGLTPVAILITHHHADHTGGIPQLLQHYPVPVFGPAEESIPSLTHALREDDVVSIDQLGAEFSVLDVPGHTSGHIAYYGHDMLFIGDTLFLAGCGRLFEGSPAQMHHSLGKILQLPDVTRIYCGHEYTLANLRFAAAVEPRNIDITSRIEACTELRRQDRPTVPASLAEERKTNPFLRTDSPAVIQAAENHAGHSLHDQIEVFANIRLWKDNFRT